MIFKKPGPPRPMGRQTTGVAPRLPAGQLGPETQALTHRPDPKAILKVIPLGGIEEVGENMTVLEYGDHIGAIPYIMPKIGDPPIFTMKLTAEFVEKRLDEFHQLGRSQINIINKDDILTLGNFRIRFFRINHNIPDGVGLAINSPAGLLIYATDWKFDRTPVDNRPTEFDKIAKYGGEGVALLMSDSTNAERPGYSMSEKTLSNTIDR